MYVICVCVCERGWEFELASVVVSALSCLPYCPHIQTLNLSRHLRPSHDSTLSFYAHLKCINSVPSEILRSNLFLFRKLPQQVIRSNFIIHRLGSGVGGKEREGEGPKLLRHSLSRKKPFSQFTSPIRTHSKEDHTVLNAVTTLLSGVENVSIPTLSPINRIIIAW